MLIYAVAFLLRRMNLGYGDDIMATAYARAIVEDDPDAKVVFGNPDNLSKPYWSPLFSNNPFIIQPKETVKKFVCVPEYPGKRRYIDYDRSVWGNPEWADGERQITAFAWRLEFRAPRGDFFFSKDEKKAAKKVAKKLPADFIIIEPNIATKKWVNNKGWDWKNWQQIVDDNPDIPFVQFGKDGPWLEGIPSVVNTFREAAALISLARGVVTAEGGLHHAAAALRKPAVVLWGHFSSPTILGYDDHTNLRQATGIGCGKTEYCKMCSESLDSISLTSVADAIRNKFDA
jgi:hypothetical protein